MAGRPTVVRVIVLALSLIVLALPTRALAVPAADEYKLRLPNARGKGEIPTAPAAAPTTTTEEPQKKKKKKEVAPPPRHVKLVTDTAGDSSLLAALLASLLDPMVLAVLLAVLAMGTVFALRSRRALAGDA